MKKLIIDLAQLYGVTRNVMREDSESRRRGRVMVVPVEW